MDTINESVYVSKIRDAGFKVTPQRLSIYMAVLESKEHPKVEHIYQSLKEANPSFTLATVYRTLESFADAGLITRIFHPGQSKRYDGNVEDHHHLVCNHCEQVSDISLAMLDLPKPPLAIEGFTPQKVQLQVLGVCDTCKNKTM